MTWGIAGNLVGWTGALPAAASRLEADVAGSLPGSIVTTRTCFGRVPAGAVTRTATALPSPTHSGAVPSRTPLTSSSADGPSSGSTGTLVQGVHAPSTSDRTRTLVPVGAVPRAQVTATMPYPSVAVRASRATSCRPWLRAFAPAWTAGTPRESISSESPDAAWADAGVAPGTAPATTAPDAAVTPAVAMASTRMLARLACSPLARNISTSPPRTVLRMWLMILM